VALPTGEWEKVAPKAEFLWAWTEGGVPRRFLPEDFDVKQLSVATETLRVHFPGVNPVPRNLEVIAAPTAMWEEIPEALLPRYSAEKESDRLQAAIPTAGEALRVRAVASGLASRWVDLTGTENDLRVHLEAARDHLLQLVEARDDQEIAVSGAVRLYATDAALRLQERMAFYQADERGEISLRAIPDAFQLAALAQTSLHPPVSWFGAGAALPAKFTLQGGTLVRGRVVLGKEPVAGLEVQVSAWFGELIPEVFHRTAVTRADGRWEIAGMPLGQLVATVKAPGFQLLRQSAVATEPVTDLGKLALLPASTLQLRVHDLEEQPVAGCTVKVRQGFETATDAKGLATLEGLPQETLHLSVAREGYLTDVREVRAPHPAELAIQLTPGIPVTGRYVDAEHRPVETGRAKIAFERSGGRTAYDGSPLESDGAFRLLMPPGREGTLYLTSPNARPVEMPVPAATVGEEVDLGEIVAPAGLIVIGTVVDAETLTPVGNAKIWTPARSKLGEMQSWLNGDVIRTHSDPEGVFQLGGLSPGAALLRIDAPGYARVHLPIQPEPETSTLKVGPIELHGGSSVVVLVEEPAAEGAIVQVDLRGERMPFDQLTAMVRDGEAQLFHVPPGRVSVTVARERKVYCETTVLIPPGEEATSVACIRESYRIQGQVLVAGSGSGEGTLTWMAPADGGGQVRSVQRFSPEGLSQGHTISTERPPVEVPVRPDGTFSSGDLRPGKWDVIWSPASGGWFETRQVVLPEQDEATVRLEYPGLRITGWVYDEEGQPVGGARVWRLGTGAMDYSSEDGSFALSLAEGGSLQLRAQLGERLSSPASLDVQVGETIPPVELILEEPSTTTLEVALVGLDETPAPGALLFVESPQSMGLRTHSSDATGRVKMTFQRPLPDQLRIAALIEGHWVFTDWQPWERLSDGTLLQARPTGTVKIIHEGPPGTVQIQAPSGQNVSSLLSLVGLHPWVEAAVPLWVQGLPSGTYTASFQEAAARVHVRAGAVAEVELP
jgi:hypothetical protein